MIIPIMKGENQMRCSRKELTTVFSNVLMMLSVFLFLVAIVQPVGAEGLLAKIKKDKKLSVGTEAAFEPFEFVKDGKIVGYGKDLLDLIVSDLGVELTQYDLPFQGIIPGLLAKKFDFVATSVAINEERAKKVAYTLPIASINNEVIVLSKNDSINSPSDLNGKVFATQLASSIQPVAEKFNEELKAKGGSGFKELKLYPAFPETPLALSSRQVDAISIATTMFVSLNKKRPGIFKTVGTIGSPEWICWITRPEDIDVRDYLNSIILKLRDNGKLYELQKKWFGTTMEIPDGGHLPLGAF
jgi:polar amino acid transport system substrate-binding protein